MTILAQCHFHVCDPTMLSPDFCVLIKHLPNTCKLEHWSKGVDTLKLVLYLSEASSSEASCSEANFKVLLY